ncbi:MAG: accessory gene regulator B family protein [Coprococcus sp.]
MKERNHSQISYVLKGSMELVGEIFSYGIKTALMLLINMISLILIGVFMKMLSESIVFILAFMILRSYTGGYHINSGIGCYIVSCISIIIAMLFCRVGIFEYIIFDLLICIVSGILIYVYSPMEHENRPLNIKERKLFRRRSIFVFCVEVILGIILGIYGVECCGIFAAIYINACAMYAELIKRRVQHINRK